MLNDSSRKKTESGFSGIYPAKYRDGRDNGWQLRLTVGGVQRYLGCYDTVAEAVMAHDAALWQLLPFISSSKLKPHFPETFDSMDAEQAYRLCPTAYALSNDLAAFHGNIDLYAAREARLANRPAYGIGLCARDEAHAAEQVKVHAQKLVDYSKERSEDLSRLSNQIVRFCNRIPAEDLDGLQSAVREAQTKVEAAARELATLSRVVEETAPVIAERVLAGLVPFSHLPSDSHE